MPDKEYDSPLGITTGAAALFGATGGVLEAALRTAAEVLTGKPLENIDFMAVRGYESVRTATVKVGDLGVNVAVVHGTARIREVVEAVLKGDKTFHLIEVMVRTTIIPRPSNLTPPSRLVLAAVLVVAVSPRRPLSIQTY